MWGMGRVAAVLATLAVVAVSLAVAPVTAAANPDVPSDVRFVSSGRTHSRPAWDRYQQYAAPLASSSTAVADRHQQRLESLSGVGAALRVARHDAAGLAPDQAIAAAADSRR